MFITAERSYTGGAFELATGVPTVPNLSGSNIHIVGEATGTPELRERLIPSGANVQVVSTAEASIVIRQIRTPSNCAQSDLRSGLRRSSLRQSVPRRCMQ